MNTIGGFIAKPGTVIQLKVHQVDADVLTFGAVLKRYHEDGGGVVARWTSAELTGGGGTAQLGAGHGDNVIVLPLSKPGTQPTMDVELTAFGPTQYNDRQTVQVGSNEPVGWRILLS